MFKWNAQVYNIIMFKKLKINYKEINDSEIKRFKESHMQTCSDCTFQIYAVVNVILFKILVRKYQVSA